MDNQRLIIWGTFGLLAWMTWQTWVADHAPQPVEPVAGETAILPQDSDAPPALPTPTTAAEPGADEPPPLAAEADAAVSSDAPVIRVTTDVLDLRISTRGGTLTYAELTKYPISKDRPEDLVVLLNQNRANFGEIRTGLNDDGDWGRADHTAVFTAPRTQYELGGADELVVPLTFANDAGIMVEKRIRVTRGSYRIDVEQRIVNGSDRTWRGAEYAQLRRRSKETDRSMFDVDSYSFDGPQIYDGEKSRKLERDDLLEEGPYDIEARAGWVAVIQHHFLSAVVPPAADRYQYSVQVRDDIVTASMIPSEATVVPPGGEHAFEMTMFVGPKLQAQLEEVSEKLELTVDYGWLTIISEPLFALLGWVHNFVGNWGLAIIIVTALIKLAFYKLTEASGRSMAKMREIQPRIQALQERYKDDRQALSQAMMDIYKREKVNPAAGCLPILIQMPFFLAFYWVLLESVEMRQAPFALWITDLSSRDPFFILPLIMGAAMLFQQKLNPTPADPVQARVMQIMPIMFTVFFAFFPSGLVLYWVTNTLLSIAQQWFINKKVHEEAQARKAGKKAKDKSSG